MVQCFYQKRQNVVSALHEWGKNLFFSSRTICGCVKMNLDKNNSAWRSQEDFMKKNTQDLHSSTLQL